MRDAREIRERVQKVLTGMLHRPSMYEEGRSYEGVVRGQLSELAFIDERETELRAAFALLEPRGLWSEYGAWGVLSAALGPGDHTDELASIYAWVAAQLRYFEAARRLSDLEWARARDVSAWARESPDVIGMADVVARFGAPSYQRAGQTPTVLAYAGPDDAAWLYFDFDEAGALRDVRLPARFPEACVDLRKTVAAEVEAPEDVYRRFLIASLSGDEAAIRPLILPSEDPSVLWAGAYPDDVAPAGGPVPLDAGPSQLRARGGGLPRLRGVRGAAHAGALGVHVEGRSDTRGPAPTRGARASSRVI
jgi:hypothetical protein